MDLVYGDSFLTAVDAMMWSLSEKPGVEDSTSLEAGMLRGDEQGVNL
jgi:hypothetical protein